ncbi:MAG: hypothetical protein JRK53_22100, partial [Deltaproteobacteria bacterium]|nr:hypothetical protein [Deltaproteobacteria bacterium]
MFRVDYLGYRYWTDAVGLPDTLEHTLQIDHEDITVTVAGVMGADAVPRPDVRVYLFTPENAYQGIYQLTDADGRAFFHLPEQAYKVRADYMSRQFWSDAFTWQDPTVVIPEGVAHVQFSVAGIQVADVTIYAFDGNGSYLGISGKTDADGRSRFRLAAGGYQFRADFQGNQYWATADVMPDKENDVLIGPGGGTFELTIDTGAGPLA